jgi:hypothetical protein
MGDRRRGPAPENAILAKKELCLVQVTAESKRNRIPIGSRSSWTGVRGGEEGSSTLVEDGWSTVGCSTVTASCGEVDAFDLGGTVNAEDSRVGGCAIFGELSRVRCVAPAVTRFGELEQTSVVG